MRASVLIGSALGLLSLSSGVHAQSKVSLWGVVDAAVRHTTNEGADKSGLTKMVGGGMSQSRWGLNIEEELGGGSKALAYLEHRFNLDTGAKDPNAPFFQLSYVGLQGPYGRLTMGRQWNVLFDVVTSTYASFPNSPYMDVYKPELGMAAGARTNNSIKYTLATEDRTWVGTLQYSFDEGVDTESMENAALASFMTGGAAGLRNFQLNTLPGMVVQAGNSLKTYGGFLRYSQNGISLGGGYLNTSLPGGSDMDAWTIGGSYRSGPLYLNMGYGMNKFHRNRAVDPGAAGAITTAVRQGVDLAILADAWSGNTNGGFQPGDANKRQMIKVGFGYQITPQINAGLHYFHAKQSGDPDGSHNGTAKFMVAAANYAFSKRTDAYFAVDHTRVSGGEGMAIDAISQTRKRSGITVGLRHRF